MPGHRVFTISFASVYPLYVAKAEKKGRTRAEVDQVIAWLAGYDAAGLEAALADGRDFATFFARAPRMNPDRAPVARSSPAPYAASASRTSPTR
jgi:hypothetical protein